MGLYSKHVVEVETVFTTKDGKKIQEGERRVESLGRGITKTTTAMDKYDKEGNKMTTITERNTRGFQRFQMEHLGVMFAGMALNRTMSNLNATAREWTGMNELMSTAMGVVMLPTTMALLEQGVIPLFDALASLPEPAKEAIGATTLALEGLGATMMVGGQLMLGLSSTLLVLQKIGGTNGAAAGATTALKGLAGISIIGVGVTLGIASIMSDEYDSILYALGSGLAIAVGAPLLGASIGTGIALGAIVISALLLWKYTSKLAEESEAFRTLSGAAPGGVQDIDLPGVSQNIQQRWSRSVMPTLPEGMEAVNITINQTNSVSGFDQNDVQKSIDKNNVKLTSEIRGMINR